MDRSQTPRTSTRKPGATARKRRKLQETASACTAAVPSSAAPYSDYSIQRRTATPHPTTTMDRSVTLRTSTRKPGATARKRRRQQNVAFDDFDAWSLLGSGKDNDIIKDEGTGSDGGEYDAHAARSCGATAQRDAAPSTCVATDGKSDKAMPDVRVPIENVPSSSVRVRRPLPRARDVLKLPTPTTRV
eukprot:NODE_19148_length_857_cov_7.353425.p1 GENE.NODE_19148_length_857_cov_7.353425~~NODE_19148_length_857_cov_7.353425.p1  ORF type:complete len:188 (+),score=11.79 NODE_19148_length_857_cov_7.353425:163-726(+)